MNSAGLFGLSTPHDPWWCFKDKSTASYRAGLQQRWCGVKQFDQIKRFTVGFAQNETTQSSSRGKQDSDPKVDLLCACGKPRGWDAECTFSLVPEGLVHFVGCELKRFRTTELYSSFWARCLRGTAPFPVTESMESVCQAIWARSTVCYTCTPSYFQSHQFSPVLLVQPQQFPPWASAWPQWQGKTSRITSSHSAGSCTRCTWKS